MRLFVLSKTCKSHVHCVAGHTLIAEQSGLKHIAKATGHIIHTGEDYTYTDGIIHRGSAPTLQISTTLGYQIEATSNHLFRVYDQKSGTLVWKSAGLLEMGDLVVMKRGYYTSGGIETHLIAAQLMGHFDGDGHIVKHSDNRRWGFSMLLEKSAPELLTLYDDWLYKELGVRFSVSSHQSSEKVWVIRSNTNVMDEWLRYWKLKTKKLNRAFELSPSCLAAYLRGLFEADGYAGVADTRGVPYTTVSVASAVSGFIHDVQNALFSIGIISNLFYYNGDTNFKKNRHLYVLKILGGLNLQKFIDLVGFASDRKKGALHRPNRCYTIGDIYPKGVKNIRSFSSLAKISKLPDDVASWIKQGYYFAPVLSIAGVDQPQQVFDVLNSSTSAFIANGFVVHNCAWCRRPEGGRAWRESIKTAYTVPDDNVDWECPEHKPWNETVEAPQKQIVPRKTIQVPTQAKSTCAPCKRKKQ